MSDQQTIGVYDAQVNKYVECIDRPDADPTLLRFIADVTAGGTVLDLGCGPGFDAGFMQDQGLKVDAVDASSEMVKLANDKYNLGARVGLFEDINQVHIYDGVWANFSLLHAQADDLPDILLAVHRALKPAGVFHLAMKTGHGSVRDKLGRYYAYYTQQQLLDQLATAGFTAGGTETGQALGMAGDMEPWIAIRSTA